MYLSDQRRRVLANLSVPRSLPEITRQIAADANAPFNRGATMTQLAAEVSALLYELEGAGWASRIGIAETPAEAIAAVADDPELPTLHPEKAEQFEDRMNGKDGWKLREGELWYFTTAGLGALTAD